MLAWSRWCCTLNRVVCDAGLLKVMLDDTNTHQLFLSINCPDSTINSRQQLAFIVKRMLLSHRNPEGVLLQIATVQTVVVVLSGPYGNLFAASILQADIAGLSVFSSTGLSGYFSFRPL